ncbi:acyltransferase [Cryobacterium sp. 1639]|uniref:acyltransferase family protein n=1 Tax=Cryobacterium inferilacus TaxID=2866629 RepID=UPI001C729D31|nr:acyltransferase family protein [Cryobacterium sp. 1639]MBX0301963.1 acyltransferase [Cryobacterium sp. 1639]
MTETLPKPTLTPQRSLRFDIQGLRAVAVLLVVAYHLWPNRLSGGFIGVDVFFVISGYLITAHLLREVALSGTVSLTQFWAKRVRRLLPAAFLVLLFTLVLVATVMPSSVGQQNLGEIAAASVYGLNWLLAFNAVDYLAAENTPSLVQHYWSLSIEEQFYILWPVLLLVAVWVAARSRKDNARSTAAYLLGAVFVVSFIASVWETTQSPASAYFVTHARAWEFAAGGLAAMLPAAFMRRLPDAAANVASWFALGLILGAAFFYTGETPFPGWTAAVPVAGTVLLLVIGDRNSHWSPQYLARFGPVQVLGDTSYAIYLWHWPLIVAFPFLTGKTNIDAKWGLVIVGVTILLSVLTQRFVESPLRSQRGPLGSRRRSLLFMATGIAVIVAITAGGSYSLAKSQEGVKESITAAIEDTDGCYGLYAITNECAEPYAHTSLTSPIFSVGDKDSWGRNDPGAESCIRTEPTPGYPARDCTFGEGATTVAFVGDSHTGHLVEPMKMAAAANDWTLRVFALGGCSTLEDQFTIDSIRDQQAIIRTEGCLDWTEHVNATLLDEKPDAVVFSSRSWHRPLDTATIASWFDELAAAGIKPIVLEDVPGMPKGTTGAACIESFLPCDTSIPERDDPVLIGAEASETTVVSFNDLLCTEDECPPVIGGAIVYADDNHLSRSFAYTLAPTLADRLGAAVMQ